MGETREKHNRGGNNQELLRTCCLGATFGASYRDMGTVVIESRLQERGLGRKDGL